MRDFQCSKVYHWEYRIKQSSRITKLEAIKLVHQIAKDYRLRYTKIEFKLDDDFSHMYCPNEKAKPHKRTYYLKFAECNRLVVCHEMAHLHREQRCKRRKKRKNRKEADHGPEFLKTYLDFLVRYCYYDRTDLEKALEKRGITYK